VKNKDRDGIKNLQSADFLLRRWFYFVFSFICIIFLWPNFSTSPFGAKHGKEAMTKNQPRQGHSASLPPRTFYIWKLSRKVLRRVPPKLIPSLCEQFYVKIKLRE
jgi:hypothetical protein